MISLVKSIVYRKYGRVFLSSYRRWLSGEQFISTDSFVKTGPYKNLKISELSNWGKGDLIGKINGAYESSVAQKLVGLISSEKMSTFIDVGCADGFHATGLGKLKSIRSVLCFDIDPKSLENCSKNAAENGILSKFEFHNRKFEIGDLESLPANSLMLVDIEGAEYALLDEEFLEIHKSKRITSIVELHDPKMTKSLIVKLKDLGFKSELFSTSQLEIDYKNGLTNLDENQVMLLLSQGRRCYQEWIVIRS